MKINQILEGNFNSYDNEMNSLYIGLGLTISNQIVK